MRQAPTGGLLCDLRSALSEYSGAEGAAPIYEGARDMARQIAKSREGRTSRRLRKKVEMLVARTVPPTAPVIALRPTPSLSDLFNRIGPKRPCKSCCRMSASGGKTGRAEWFSESKKLNC